MIRVQSVSETSSLFELTRFLSTSFQESERIQVEQILAKREQGFKDQILNFKQILEKDVKFLEKEVQVLEKQVKDEHFIKEVLENEVKGLKEKSGLMEKKLALAFIEKREVEDKMERQCEMFEDEIEAMQKDFKQELEKLRDYHNKELERDVGFMEKKLSFAALEKLILEEEVRKNRIGFEEKMKGYGETVKQIKEERDIMKAEMEKSRENYAELKRERVMSDDKLILAELEIGNLVEGLRNIRKEFEEKLKEHCDLFEKEGHLNQKMFEDELNKLRENNKKELEGERDMSENKLILADLDKMDLGEELRKSRVDFEQRLEALEGKNRVLHKQLELYKGTSVSICKSTGKEKSGFSFLENEPEDGSDNDNLMCKRKRIDGSNNDKVNPAVESDTDENSAFTNDPELCMAGVIALYRKHISAVNPSNILAEVDIFSATAVARYLIKEDPTNKINRSLLEVEQDCPHVLQTCQRLAIKYKDQLLEIYKEQLLELYQKDLDPLFRSK